MSDEHRGLVWTIREIAKRAGWSPETFLDALLKALYQLESELTDSQAQALIDELDDMS